MAAEIRVFPCLSDNFGYLIHDPQSLKTAAIDAPEAGPIMKVLQREGWKLTDILVTHHHADHVGGIAELKTPMAAASSRPMTRAPRFRWSMSALPKAIRCRSAR